MATSGACAVVPGAGVVPGPVPAVPLKGRRPDAATPAVKSRTMTCTTTPATRTSKAQPATSRPRIARHARCSPSLPSRPFNPTLRPRHKLGLLYDASRFAEVPTFDQQRGRGARPEPCTRGTSYGQCARGTSGSDPAGAYSQFRRGGRKPSEESGGEQGGTTLGLFEGPGRGHQVAPIHVHLGGGGCRLSCPKRIQDAGDHLPRSAGVDESIDCREIVPCPRQPVRHPLEYHEVVSGLRGMAHRCVRQPEFEGHVETRRSSYAREVMYRDSTPPHVRQNARQPSLSLVRDLKDAARFPTYGGQAGDQGHEQWLVGLVKRQVQEDGRRIRSRPGGHRGRADASRAQSGRAFSAARRSAAVTPRAARISVAEDGGAT
jgi:hypothetical protein